MIHVARREGKSMTLLVSSMSARGRALAQGREIFHLLQAGGWEVDIHVTTSEHDVELESSRSQQPFVAALGGDGYLTAAARGRISEEAPLIPFPGGRGNDLCRSLGIGADPLAWARIVAGATAEDLQDWTRPLDAMKISSSQRTEIALGIVSMGVDAAANKVANDSWLRSGPIAYSWGAVASFLGLFKPQEIEGYLDGELTNLGYWLSSISNSGWFGGGINILPQSRSDDGTLEVATVEKASRLRVLPVLVRALSMRRLDDPIAHVYTAKKVELTGPKGLLAMADGDVVGYLPLTVEVLPAALNVVTREHVEDNQ